MAQIIKGSPAHPLPTKKVDEFTIIYRNWCFATIFFNLMYCQYCLNLDELPIFSILLANIVKKWWKEWGKIAVINPVETRLAFVVSGCWQGFYFFCNSSEGSVLICHKHRCTTTVTCSLLSYVTKWVIQNIPII